MLDFPAIQTAIQTVIRAALSGDVASGDVYWSDTEDASYSHSLPYAALTVLDEPRSLGVDATDYTYNDTEGRFDVAQSGNILFTVRVEITSDDACTVPARALIHKARARIRRPCNLATLDAASVAVVRFSQASSVAFEADHRAYSRASFDVEFSAWWEDEHDGCEGSGDWFNTADVSGAVLQG